MTIVQVLELIDSAMASEREWLAEQVKREEFWHAAEAQARLRALQALRQALLARLALEGKQEG